MGAGWPLRVARISLAATVWASALLFGFYILAFYAFAVVRGDMEAWNTVLPRLYEPDTPAANSGMAVHFAAGGIILMLGAIQLLGAVRARWPAFHRWVGRVYVLCALVAGVGGLTFIAAKGTIGGTVMDVGFGLYGVLMILAALQTLRHARARRLDPHRAWAIRLFALAIGSWLYRMEYGFWFMLTDGIGHESDFSGPFDQVMAFFFYLPNLVVAEAVIRSRGTQASAGMRIGATVAMTAATAFLLVGTYFFARYQWGPAIAKAVAG